MIEWKEITEFEGPEQSPGFLLWQISTEWRRQIEAALSELGLTHPQFVLLACLGWLTRGGKKITQAELSRFCKTDINMTSQVLRTLEKRKLIQRKQSKSDERSKFPSLTKDGAALVERAIPIVETVDRAFFSNETSLSLLQKLV